jgi:mono/diheme cytochrome c family protein
MKRIFCLFSCALMACALVRNGAQAQSLPAAKGAVTPAQPVAIQPPQPAPAPQPPLENFISFDAGTKEVTVTNGTTEAQFTFNITNISSDKVMVNFVQTSCGCTVAKLPSTPWVIAPNTGGEISATMQLAGTPPGQSKIKTLTVSTDKGAKTLYVRATVLPPPPDMSDEARKNNLKTAMADRQAVFKGDCASCHVEKAKDKTGQELFAAACGICHEGDHRATFVPNLRRLPEQTSPEFWKNWVAHGKPGTLMPAFAQSEGGPLTDEQITSLVAYLNTAIPPHPNIATIPTRTAIQ